MKTFRDFINAYPAEDDCSCCGQPSGWPWIVSMSFLEELRELAEADDLEVAELQELLDLAGEAGEITALGDCPLIWDQFLSWRRQQTKMQQLGINYGLINRPTVGE
jgi:hypothetical protein